MTKIVTSADLWSGLADRVQAIRELREEERTADDLDDRIGIRHFVNEKEAFLGRWVFENAEAIAEALQEFAWLVEDLKGEWRHRTELADDAMDNPSIARYHRCVRVGIAEAISLARERGERAGIVRPLKEADA